MGTKELLSALSTAAERRDGNTVVSLAKIVLESGDYALMLKGAQELYRAVDVSALEQRALLLQAAYDILFEPHIDERGRTCSSNVPISTDHRRATQYLGLDLESRGDSDGANAVYQRAIELGLWSRQDQRPQHYFPNIVSGPYFPDPSQYRDAVELLEKNHRIIFKELVQHRKFPGKLYLDTEKLSISGRWLQATFWHQGKWNKENVELFPKTSKILKEIADQFAFQLPDAVFQMSTLAPGTVVRPHCGSANHKVRLHLALYVPRDCGIRAAGETSHWIAGKVLVIDDSYVHEVWNHSAEPRTVLIVDVWASGVSEQVKRVVREYFVRRDRVLNN